MKKTVKKVFALSLTAAMSLSATAGFVNADDGNGIEGATIEIAYNNASVADDFFALVGEWADENGVKIEETSYGEEHEAQMKTRMGSGDLPDIWLTHGWSVNRYGEYLMDLSDQPWVDDIDAGLRDVLTTEDGEIYVLPITQSVACITYNKDVLDAAGVVPEEIRTWDDFTEACAKVKENTDAAPIMMSLGDESFDAYALELVLPSFYSNSDVAGDELAKLLDGSFNWETDAATAWDLISSWYDSGFYNEDLVSCKKDDICSALAYGEGAFTMYSTMNPSILSYNPEANIGLIPVPASADDKASYFGVGEGNYGCFGIWKDTEYPEACKALFEYLATTEAAEQVCDWDGGIPGLTSFEMPQDTDAASTATAYKTAQEQFDGDLVYDNYFDREYLPSGMWESMKNAIKELLTDGDPTGHITAAATILQDSYDELIG